MDSFAEVWQGIKELIKEDENMTEVLYNLWFDPLMAEGFDGNKAVLSTTSVFKLDVLHKYEDYIRSKIKEFLGFDVSIEFIVREKKEEEKPLNTNLEVYRSINPVDGLPPLRDDNDEFSFENFIVGQSNRFAHAACIRVAECPGSVYNPLLIHGKSGLGKTHLLLAISHRIKKTNPNANILYTTGENFTNELINCIATNNTFAFHNKYRNVDVLLVDDIHFIQNKVSTQEEFFHTFNTLIQADKQIVLTSDRPPKEMLTLDERLRTRFEWGLLADVYPPDIDTRMAIIKSKSEKFNIKLEDNVLEFIAEKNTSNIRQIEGTLKKISAFCLLEGKTPTIEMAERAINDVLIDNQPVSVKVDSIVKTVADFYGVSVEDIKSENRSANITIARQVAMYIIRDCTPLPLNSIGELLGNRNHSTVHYSVSQVEKQMKRDLGFKNQVNDIIRSIND